MGVQTRIRRFKVRSYLGCQDAWLLPLTEDAQPLHARSSHFADSAVVAIVKKENIRPWLNCQHRHPPLSSFNSNDTLRLRRKSHRRLGGLDSFVESRREQRETRSLVFQKNMAVDRHTWPTLRLPCFSGRPASVKLNLVCRYFRRLLI